MNNIDSEYSRIANKVLQKGIWRPNRTGVPALTIVGDMIQHDMAEGFPLLTSRRVPFKNTAIELEFFIKGLRSKKWLQDRGCHFWDSWCSPLKIEYSKKKGYTKTNGRRR